MKQSSPPHPLDHPQSLSDQDWFTIEEIDRKTFSIGEYGQWMKLHSYLFIGSERAALIDTGLGVGNIQTVVASLTTLPITVITTHAHWDHVGNHNLFRDLRIHEAEKPWLEEGYKEEADEIREYLVERPFSRVPPKDFQLAHYNVPRCQPTGLLEDGQQMNLGGRELTFLHTPGHSPGHLCIHEEETGFLVTGDLLYQGTLLAGLSDSNPAAFLESLTRMNQLDRITRLLPGHGRLTIDRTLLKEAEQAFLQLKQKGQLAKGTGLHPFERLVIQL
ncbi:MBL fold metallo-hydrolase [bacterium]|nr:MBL fold metallo-hydrolase [Verrucomicrobiota bacterium]MDA7497354.1 MBL fold metallo-hydrolase [bacterium]MDA7510508.1 MBL fold metallo-hydrolase [Verrucomicrobiota bacterium]